MSMVRTTPEQFPDDTPSERVLPLGEEPIFEYLRHHAETRPEKPAINFHGATVSYAELDEASDRFATYLSERGYDSRDTVLIHLQNTPQYYIAYYGGLKADVRVAPCQPMSKGHRLKYQINDAEASLLLTHDINAETVADVRRETGLREVLYVRYESFLPETPVPALHDEVEAAVDSDRRPTDETTGYLHEALERTDPAPPDIDVDMDDVRFLLYSSGTTGLPKGCMHTHRNTVLMSGSIATIFDFKDFDPHVCTLPLCHAAGLFAAYPQMIFGNTVVVLSRYDPDGLLAAIDEYGPQIGMLTSQVVTDLFDHPDLESFDLSSMEYAPTVGFGTPVDEEMANRWRDLTGGALSEYTYGGVEYHGDVTFTYGLDHEQETGFCGRPMYDIDVVIRDFDTHEPLDVGEVGEITVDSPSLLEGYWNMPEATADTFHGDYYLSGDIGRLTEEGYLYYLGRQKYMIKYSGFSIAPAEVETILETHPGITEAGVVGRPHDERGEIPTAFVTTSNGTLSETDVIEWSKDQMAAYKRPRDVVIVDSLPWTDLGKLDRQQLIERVSE